MQQLKEDLLRAHQECGTWDAKDIRAWALAHPETALFAYLEKDADKALFEHQVAQIRGLIARYKLIAPDPVTDAPVAVRAVLSDPGNDARERVYVDRSVAENQRETMLRIRIDAWKFCVTRIANVGAAGDAEMLQRMREHLARLEEELGGVAA